MIKLDTPIFKALTVVAALLPLSCSGDADTEKGENQQGIAEDGSDGDGGATTGDDATGSTDGASASNGSGVTGSGDAVTSGSATSGVGGANDGSSATSDGEAAGGTGGASATGGAPATDGAGGSGSTGDSDASTSGGDATGGGGSPECEQIQCFRAIECVETCDGPVLKSGCCPCDEGTFDRIECSSTTQGGDCVDGAMMDDGCNTCTCANGSWACTERACPEATVCGGWAGNTCSATEYCAYVAGQHCGAADASATCKPRPEACTQEYDPVCGCDGKTYGNDCTAAAAGTGVMSEGPCASE